MCVHVCIYSYTLCVYIYVCVLSLESRDSFFKQNRNLIGVLQSLYVLANVKNQSAGIENNVP